MSKNVLKKNQFPPKIKGIREKCETDILTVN